MKVLVLCDRYPDSYQDGLLLRVLHLARWIGARHDLDPDAKTALARARAALHAGEVVEFAGYELSPELANGMEASSFELPAPGGCAVAMLEVDGSGRAAPSPALAALRARLEGQGATVSLEKVTGPAFWQTQEIEIAPELIERSCHVLEVLGR